MFTLAARMSMCAIAAGACAGCFDPRTSRDELGPGIGRPTDLFAPDASDVPVCATPDPSPLSMLHVRVRTTPVGGRFAPRNVGAVWIERSDGAFVKTLTRWGQIRAKWLTRFVAASNNNVVDAITGATLQVHQTHDLEWDLRDLARCEIATGDYRVVMETTDRDATGVSFAIPFSKDQLPASSAPADTPQFHDLLVELD